MYTTRQVNPDNLQPHERLAPSLRVRHVGRLNTRYLYVWRSIQYGLLPQSEFDAPRDCAGCPEFM